MKTIKQHIKDAINRNNERNRRLKTLLKSIPAEMLNVEIDPVAAANDAHARARKMGIERFIHEEFDVDDMALREILGNMPWHLTRGSD